MAEAVLLTCGNNQCRVVTFHAEMALASTRRCPNCYGTGVGQDVADG